MTEQFYTRAREFDLAPLVQVLAVDYGHMSASVARTFERNKEDTALAVLLALAVAAKSVRDAFDLPVEAWAEANSLALNRASLTNQLSQLPFVAELEAGLNSTRNHG